MSSQPKPTTGECSLCNTGFPLDERGNHIPTQSLGMIPVTRCKKLPKPTTGEWTTTNDGIAWASSGAEISMDNLNLVILHNAALASERERLEKEWGREGIHITLERLKRELDAERERHEKLMQEMVEQVRLSTQQLRSQLAAAQAAMRDVHARESNITLQNALEGGTAALGAAIAAAYQKGKQDALNDKTLP